MMRPKKKNYEWPPDYDKQNILPSPQLLKNYTTFSDKPTNADIRNMTDSAITTQIFPVMSRLLESLNITESTTSAKTIYCWVDYYRAKKQSWVDNH